MSSDISTDEESQGASQLPSGDNAQPPSNATGGTGGSMIAVGQRRSISDLLRNELSFVPVLVTLIIVVLVFQFASNGLVLTTDNVSNVIQQIVTPGIIAIAAVLVLLLGEIDLSLAAVSQACGAIMGVLLVRQDWNPWLAILGALIAGALIGFINGILIAILRIPSFIVTLAGSIGYAGLLLVVLEPQTTLQINDETVRSLSNSHLDSIVSYTIAIVVIVAYGGAKFLTRASRIKAGLRVQSVAQLALNVGIVAVVLLGSIIALDTYEGIPTPTAIWIGLVMIAWLVLTQTSFGRHVYAVGGNAEASRRAGINVVWLRVMIFTLASTIAAVAGIMAASRATSAASQINPTLLLNSIAAAVIGGVSLFGGRGTVWAVVLGSLVIGSLENGLNLLNADQGIKNIAEGIVLIVAVAADALLRRSNTTR